MMDLGKLKLSAKKCESSMFAPLETLLSVL